MSTSCLSQQTCFRNQTFKWSLSHPAEIKGFTIALLWVKLWVAKAIKSNPFSQNYVCVCWMVCCESVNVTFSCLRLINIIIVLKVKYKYIWTVTIWPFYNWMYKLLMKAYYLTICWVGLNVVLHSFLSTNPQSNWTFIKKKKKQKHLMYSDLFSNT